MKNDRHEAWKRHTGIDSLFNGGILGVAIAGLLLAALIGPVPDAGSAGTGRPAEALTNA